MISLDGQSHDHYYYDQKVAEPPKAIEPPHQRSTSESPLQRSLSAIREFLTFRSSYAAFVCLWVVT